ncbi:uncharacterized protein PG998_006420 [Apiospora kogelbergensis]|uniref:uncharacterized protein n=1 Tax=Apiospora kogelbergensis TaxID=1337665 RepID=UPI00312CF870
MEGLPAELRCLLLRSVPDLATLQSFVRSSPVMHAQYREDRNSILRSCLSREMHGYGTDAYANAMSRACEPGSPRSNREIAGFLDIYKSASPPGIDSISPDGLCWLAAFHTTVALPLARRYARWSLANLWKASYSPKDVGVCVNEEMHGLSKGEEVRIMKAIYRHEAYNHLFGQHEDQRDGSFTSYDIHGVFFCKFEPWESEAIGCIDVFLRQQYSDMFDRINNRTDATTPDQASVQKRENGATSKPIINPGFNGLNPAGFAKMAESLATLHHIDRIIARGLKSSAWLLQIDNHAKLSSAMQDHLEQLGRDVGSKDDPMRLALGTNAQQFRRMVRSADPRDEAEARRDPIAFLGDYDENTVSPGEGAEVEERPPIAWVRLWKGRYSHLYGDYVPLPVRKWGYVMWDERRWADLGALDLVAKQWKKTPELAERINRNYHWSPIEG